MIVRLLSNSRTHTTVAAVAVVAGQALPAYYSALKALEALDKKQIQEVKSFANPPKAVGTVMAAVCLLLGRKETWEDSKKLLNEINFLTMLRDYDKVRLCAVIESAVLSFQ